MGRKKLGVLVIIFGCSGAQWCEAAQLPATSATRASDLTDEVLVHGARLSDLNAALLAAEDQFYARYNELNKVDAFDIECTTDIRTGTKLPHRVCLTKLQRDAKAQNGSEYLQNLQDLTKVPDGTLGLGKPPDTYPQGGVGRALPGVPRQHAIPAEDESRSAALGARAG